MPWTVSDPPSVAQTWEEAEKRKCVSAANATLNRGGTEQEAVFACIYVFPLLPKSAPHWVDRLLSKA